MLSSHNILQSISALLSVTRTVVLLVTDIVTVLQVRIFCLNVGRCSFVTIDYNYNSGSLSWTLFIAPCAPRNRNGTHETPQRRLRLSSGMPLYYLNPLNLLHINCSAKEILNVRKNGAFPSL